MAQVPTTIRRARLDDAPAVAEVYIASRRAAAAVIPTAHTDDEIRAWVSGWLMANNDVWVAEADGAVIAMMALDRDMIEQLYIAPEAQRHGVGGALLDVAMRERPARLRLYTFTKSEQARRFYESRGFRAIEFTDGSGNEEHEPDVLYEWTPKRD